MSYQYHIYIGNLIVYSTNSRTAALRRAEDLSAIHKVVALYQNSVVSRIWARS